MGWDSDGPTKPGPRHSGGPPRARGRNLFRPSPVPIGVEDRAEGVMAGVQHRRVRRSAFFDSTNFRGAAISAGRRRSCSSRFLVSAIGRSTQDTARTARLRGADTMDEYKHALALPQRVVMLLPRIAGIFSCRAGCSSSSFVGCGLRWSGRSAQPGNRRPRRRSRGCRRAAAWARVNCVLGRRNFPHTRPLRATPALSVA